MAYERLNLKDGEKFSAEHVSHIEDGIVQNALDLEGKQDKGDYLTSESTIPSEKIVEDFEHRFTNDSEKVAWNSKAEGTHRHSISDVEGLQTALDGKADSNHNHDERYYNKSNVNELLSGKAGKVHTHEISDVNGLSDELNGVKTSIDGKADVTHYHNMNEVNGLDDALNGCSPKVHGHEMSDVNGLSEALDRKSENGHGHTIADVTGLQTALDGKSNTNHNHVSADITDLENFVDERIGVVAGSALDEINGEVV